MKLPAVLSLACVWALLLWSPGARATPFPFNMSMESSGDGEPEIFVPTAFSTRGPAAVSPTVEVTTAVRIKNFILNEVVDFLRENLLLILVVSSLLIVLIFIVCCASVMSHRRKLKAYYPSSFPAKKYVDQRDKNGGRRTFNEVPENAHDSRKTASADSDKQLQTDSTTVTKNLRTPSKALVGERGKDPKPKASSRQAVHPEKPKVEEPASKAEKEEEQKKEHKPGAAPGQPLVCLCHLRNASPPKPDTDKDK